MGRTPTEPPAWQDAALNLTVDELIALRDSLRALAEPHDERLARSELRPSGARPVAFLQLAFPDEES